MKNLVYQIMVFICFCILLESCNLFIEPDVNIINKGTCEVRISGYIERTFSGQAIFDNIPDGRGYTIFILLLKDIVEPGKNYRIVEFQGSKPDAGIHKLFNYESKDDSTKGVLFGRYGDSQVEGSFKSLSGSIEIYISTKDELKGSADFPAFEYVPLGNGQYVREEIKITATFYAVAGNTGIIIN